MTIPQDYAERVYAGVLGKIIGVYLGRPFEGWLYQQIMEELGEIWYYVHEKRNMPLIVTDDDISGTFTFLRALPDHGNSINLTPEQIGQTWLNYLIENRTVLWWGGMGNSTEHTAYLRLKHGIRAPKSGSMALNGKVVAEQIGAQIFIDGWAMVAPGNPDLAADLARRAASVSHDGEAIYGAQVLAAMEAQAFVEQDIQKLIDIGVSFIPKESIIYRMIADLREWHAELCDWRDARLRVVDTYGYGKYGGNCHMIPNHALIILGLLYGEDNFQKSLMITNTCGWDTDCNSGNIGCLLGIKNGLAGIDTGPDWRGPVADRLYLSTADGGRCVSDAVTETFQIVNIGRKLVNMPALSPKEGARFHFELPGSLQGWHEDESPESRFVMSLRNEPGHSLKGSRSLALRFEGLAPGRAGRVATATFITPDTMKMPGYSLFASPTLYSGQVVKMGLEADPNNEHGVDCIVYIEYYGENDSLQRAYGPEVNILPGAHKDLSWKVKSPTGAPIAKIGLEIDHTNMRSGCVYLDYCTWTGCPEVELGAPEWKGSAWQKAWVNGVDHFISWAEPMRIIQDEGTGLLIQGTREWQDYRVEADITPHMVKACGLAGRVQGMRRYYALQLVQVGKVHLVKSLDGETILGEIDFPWAFGETYILAMAFSGNRIRGWVNGSLLFDLKDDNQPLDGGAAALLCTEGRTSSQNVRIQPS
jgi:ADP-ribosylglycohydrolase